MGNERLQLWFTWWGELGPSLCSGQRKVYCRHLSTTTGCPRLTNLAVKEKDPSDIPKTELYPGKMLSLESLTTPLTIPLTTHLWQHPHPAGARQSHTHWQSNLWEYTIQVLVSHCWWVWGTLCIFFSLLNRLSIKRVLFSVFPVLPAHDWVSSPVCGRMKKGERSGRVQGSANWIYLRWGVDIAVSSADLRQLQSRVLSLLPHL